MVKQANSDCMDFRGENSGGSLILSGQGYSRERKTAANVSGRRDPAQAHVQAEAEM
jgi:hypothetical protein